MSAHNCVNYFFIHLYLYRVMTGVCAVEKSVGYLLKEMTQTPLEQNPPWT